MDMLEEILVELKSTFPSAVPNHPLNVNDDTFDDLDLDFNEAVKQMISYFFIRLPVLFSIFLSLLSYYFILFLL